MDKQEMEFFSFMELCVVQRRNGKTVDEILALWQDRQAREEHFKNVLNKMSIRELQQLEAFLKLHVG